MKRVTLFVFFLLSGIVITFTIAGCAGYLPPTINLRADGVIEHIDTQDSPCGYGGGGCYHRRVDGSRHIWKSGESPQYVTEHENAHALGMMHDEFQREWNHQLCAKVTDSGGKYTKGQTICIDQRGETVF